MRFNKFVNATEFIIISPCAQAILAILVVFVGLWGTLFTNEIRSTFPFDNKIHGKVVYESIVFWGCFVLTSIAYFLGYNFQRRVERNNSHALRQAILHAPPVNWMQGFVVRLNEIHSMAAVIDNTTSKIDVENAMRATLYAIADLVNQMGPVSGRRIAACLMVYYPSCNMSREFSSYLEGKLRFCDPSLGIHRLKGVLNLNKVFSTALDDSVPAGDIDPSIDEFSLEIPVDPKTTEGKLRTGPGAPFAFTFDEVQYFSEVSHIVNWVTTNANLQPAVIQEFQRYFGFGSFIQSFVSMPVHEGITSSKTIIGVLNIHANQKGLLPSDQETYKLICQAISAFDPVIAKLLKIWKEK